MCGRLGRGAVANGSPGSEFIDGEMKYIRDFKDKDWVNSYSLLRARKVVEENGKSPYLHLTLGDRTGEIEARGSLDSADIEGGVRAGDIVSYEGVVEVSNGDRRLLVRQVSRAKPEARGRDFDIRDLIRVTASNIDQMWDRLRSLIRRHTKRPCVLQLLSNILDVHRDKVRSYPAATEVHHNCWGGFLEHVLSVFEGAIFFANRYPGLDKDLLVAGAVLHDIGKLEELGNPENPSYTTRGTLIGHVVLGRDLLREEAAQIEGFPSTLLMLLEHLVLSHQGLYEWGSPKRPKIPEALIIHYVDDLDSKMNRFSRLLMEDRGQSDFTPFDRYLNRVVFKGSYESSEH